MIFFLSTFFASCCARSFKHVQAERIQAMMLRPTGLEVSSF